MINLNNQIELQNLGLFKGLFDGLTKANRDLKQIGNDLGRKADELGSHIANDLTPNIVKFIDVVGNVEEKKIEK